jgi:hypothetical protein
VWSPVILRQRARDVRTNKLRKDQESSAHKLISQELSGQSAPGNSVRETGERMKGGAVREDRSPEKDAMLRRADEA